MLELYFSRPDTLDRIRSSWIIEPIEKYINWLTQQKYSWRSVSRRVPILLSFGEFARCHGAAWVKDLPAYIEPFVEDWLKEHAGPRKLKRHLRKAADCVRNPIRQMLSVVLPDCPGFSRRHKLENPFATLAPDFFVFLRQDKGLSEGSLLAYSHHLRAFARYLQSIGLDDLRSISPPVLSAFVTSYKQQVAWASVRNQCGVLRVFFRYLYSQRLLDRDLSGTVQHPVAYRLSGIPRCLGWEDVRRMLQAVDTRSPVGKRDYAMLLLLITYGLRGCEVAALTLDDLDWRNERLRIPERKAGHSTAYPLSPLVGQAILDYLRQGRPETSDRRIFFRSQAPRSAITAGALSSRVAHYLGKAGIKVHRPGAHTLRHTCVQRLVDQDFSLKIIGDYIGHRSPSSTEIYSKIAVEKLREVACGDGEEIL